MKRLLILNVDDDKYRGFVEFAAKRNYIEIISMDREARKHLRDCPCCSRKLSQEATFQIDDYMVESLTHIVRKMKITKTVILVNKENPQNLVPSIEVERCVETNQLTTIRAEVLGLLKSFTDGSRITHFVTAKGLSFLSGDMPASPSWVTTLDGVVVETGGSTTIESIKFKNAIKEASALRDASDAVKALPENVANFVRSGQMSLI